MISHRHRPPHRTSATRPGVVKATLAATLLWIGLTGPAAASPEQAEHVIGLFSRLCYEPMPDLDAVEAAVDPAWQPLAGEELEGFRPSADTALLKAWNIVDQGGNFSLAISSGPMDEQGQADFPAFSDATNFGCSLVLNATEVPPGAVQAGLEKLLEREADESFEQGPLDVSAWTGGSDEILVILYHYAPKSGAPGGLLSMTVFLNP